MSRLERTEKERNTGYLSPRSGDHPSLFGGIRHDDEDYNCLVRQIVVKMNSPQKCVVRSLSCALSCRLGICIKSTVASSDIRGLDQDKANCVAMSHDRRIDTN